MQSKLMKLLNWLRFLDENGDLSLSNIAVMIVLVKVATTANLDLASTATLLGVLSNYGFKRFTQRKDKQDPDAIAGLADMVTKVHAEVTMLKTQVGYHDDEIY